MARGRTIRSGFALPDYLREITATYFELRALRIRVSELRPENRDAESVRAIEDALSPLALEGVARIFRLPEGDYLLGFRDTDTDRVRTVLVELRFLIPDDPLTGLFGGVAGQDNALLQWQDLKTDIEDLRLLAKRYERTAVARAEATARRSGSRAGHAKEDAALVLAEAEEAAFDQGNDGDLSLEEDALPEHDDGDVYDETDPAHRGIEARGIEARGVEDRGVEDRGVGGQGLGVAAALPPLPLDWRPLSPDAAPPPDAPGTAWMSQPWTDGKRECGGRQPITAEILDRLENGLAQADLSNHVRWQRVCAIVGSAPPRPMFTEIYVSIPELRETIAPRIDLTSNLWLFQHFTETLDRRVLSYLNREGVSTSKDGFSVNLNVQTILSDTFLRFEQVLAAGMHGTVVLELRLEDVFADLDAYVFARDYVRQRGYRLCIDGLDVDTLMLIDRARLGADLLKLFWTPELPSRMISDEGLVLAARLRAGEGARTILARCESAQAISLGQELGITLFQGRHVDSLQHVIDPSIPVVNPARR